MTAHNVIMFVYKDFKTDQTKLACSVLNLISSRKFKNLFIVPLDPENKKDPLKLNVWKLGRPGLGHVTHGCMFAK
jgi:hypothetical protein